MSNEEIEKPDVEANEQADTEASAETEKTTEQLLEEAQQQAEENWNQVLLARADLENDWRAERIRPHFWLGWQDA